MVEKFGVSLDEETAQRVEQARIRGDVRDREVVSRSEAVRELVALGLVATDVIERADGLDLAHGHPREAFVRQALLNELEREGLSVEE